MMFMVVYFHFGTSSPVVKRNHSLFKSKNLLLNFRSCVVQQYNFLIQLCFFLITFFQLMRNTVFLGIQIFNGKTKLVYQKNLLKFVFPNFLHSFGVQSRNIILLCYHLFKFGILISDSFCFIKILGFGIFETLNLLSHTFHYFSIFLYLLLQALQITQLISQVLRWTFAF